MPRSIKEFRENGQLHRLAIVDGNKIVSIRVFDADGSEFKWVNPKPWKLNSQGNLVGPKQSVKDNYEEENGPIEQQEPTLIGHRNSIAGPDVPEDPYVRALGQERVALREMVSALLEVIELIKRIASEAFMSDGVDLSHEIREIERIAHNATRQTYDEDR